MYFIVVLHDSLVQILFLFLNESYSSDLTAKQKNGTEMYLFFFNPLFCFKDTGTRGTWVTGALDVCQ